MLSRGGSRLQWLVTLDPKMPSFQLWDCHFGVGDVFSICEGSPQDTKSGICVTLQGLRIEVNPSKTRNHYFGCASPFFHQQWWGAIRKSTKKHIFSWMVVDIPIQLWIHNHHLFAVCMFLVSLFAIWRYCWFDMCGIKTHSNINFWPDFWNIN